MLYDDGDTATLTDGRTVRLRIEVDEYYDGFQEVECYAVRLAVEIADETGRQTG